MADSIARGLDPHRFLDEMDLTRAVVGREADVSVRDNEVLVQNTPAIPLYEGLGFRALRKLETWARSAGAAAPGEPEVGVGPAPAMRSSA